MRTLKFPYELIDVQVGEVFAIEDDRYCGCVYKCVESDPRRIFSSCYICSLNYNKFCRQPCLEYCFNAEHYGKRPDGKCVYFERIDLNGE